MTDKLQVPPLQEPIVDTRPINPYHIALVIDNLVHDVLSVEGKQAAQYMSQPKFIQISYREADVGWVYDEETKTFSLPPNPEQ